jgi:Asp-tRNA(Asn)/Glu-tRNA(Gln) amidotransferase A subunit family amidase
VPDYLAALGGDLKGVRLGLPHNTFAETMEPDVAAANLDALGVLKAAGATLVDVRFPRLDSIVGAHRAILFSEASAAHQQLVRTRAAELGDDVRPLLQAGLFLGASHYLAAQQARRLTIAAFRDLWRTFDVLVLPASPVVATPLEATTARLAGEDRPLVRVFLDVTLPFNLTGQPALSVPCGFGHTGLPVGLQLVGRPFEEGLLLRVGAAYEAATRWHERVPPI